MQKMKERILQGFFQATNERDFSQIPKLYSPQATIHTRDGKKAGPSAIIAIFQKWLEAFPDLQLEPLIHSVEEDQIVVHWRGKGTFLRQLRGISPTGKMVTMHGFTCFRCAHDQIIEHWAHVDYRPLGSDE